MNQFVVTAVAEKISAMSTAAFFEDRRSKADRKAFRRMLNRKGGKPPREGDELEGLVAALFHLRENTRQYAVSPPRSVDRNSHEA